MTLGRAEICVNPSCDLYHGPMRPDPTFQGAQSFDAVYCRRDTSPRHGGKDIEAANRPTTPAGFDGSQLDPGCGWLGRGVGFARNTTSLYEWRKVVKSWGHILGFFPLLGLVRPVPVELFGLLNNPHQ